MTTHHHHFTIGAAAPKGSVYDLPARSLIADEYRRAYRVSNAKTAVPFDAGAPRNLESMDEQGPVTVLSIPGEELYADHLDALPVGAYVVDHDGDLWRRADMPTGVTSVYAAVFVLCTMNIGEGFGSMVPFPDRPTVARSARSLIDDYGPVVGSSTEPGSIRARGHVVPGVLETVDDESLSHFFSPDEPERPGKAEPVSTDPGDPDTADDSLELDDLCRAQTDSIVSDCDGDLWRRQAAADGSLWWVLVVEDGLQVGRVDASASSSARLRHMYGPITPARWEDAMRALALPKRRIEQTDGHRDTYALDPDAAVERALDRARAVLTGDGENVAVAIGRDADGRVHLRTEVTEKVTGEDD